MIRFFQVSCFLGLVGPLLGSEGKTPIISQQQAAFFESRIRPILVENCFRCHGPKKQEAGLRLDSRAGLLKGGETGPALVPGQPEKSLLLSAVKQSGEVKMPPPPKEKLSAQTVADLTDWIKMGAPWPEPKVVEAPDPDAWKKHWAFQPVKNPPVPEVKNKPEGVHPIDRFILAKLEEKGLQPTHKADRRTLIRRASFDLIGLPPTPEEIAAFENDPEPEAFAKVVDRLLASPHYGERWGRHWLDVARYADTKGYVFFQDAYYPWAWTYRDYVIEAFNNDVPFDRFILEQLAADLLPLGEDKRSLRAMGFLTLGGRFMNNLHDILDDRLDVVTRGMMGLTVTCARCHDHKYDPIPAKDYYSLYGVLASSVEPVVPPLYESPPKTEEYARFDKELREREQKLVDFVKRKHEELVKSAKTRMAEYLMAAHALRDQPSQDNFMLLADTKDLNPAMIQRWKKYLDLRAKKHDPVWAPWFAFAALSKKEFFEKAPALVTKFIKSDGKAINSIVVEHLFQKKSPPKDLADLAKRYQEMLAYGEIYLERCDRIDKACLQNTLVKEFLSLGWEEVLHVFRAPEAPPNIKPSRFGDLALLPDRPSQAELQKLRKALEEWRSQGKGAPPRANVLEELQAPFEPYVFLRGNPSNRGDQVPRQLPMVLGGKERQPFHKGSGRLELAQAIASRDNPLTARVFVNRVWMYHFGAGLVRTPSDFGLRSDPPSHPELLDHLASWFINNSWSIKKLHRYIMLSATYQQASSAGRAERGAQSAKPGSTPLSPLRAPHLIDPDNRLLWKMNRHRLDFETTRDALLAVAGKLDPSVGGPSIKDNFSPAATRRTLYSFLDRLNVPGLFRTFDFPSPDATSPERSLTTVPPQALFLMNHPFVMECARNVMKRPEIAREKDPATKIDRLYRLLYGRAPAGKEMDLARTFLQSEGFTQPAWDRYAHALLLANEFVFVD